MQPLLGLEEQKQGVDHPGIDGNVVIFMVQCLLSITLDILVDILAQINKQSFTIVSGKTTAATIKAACS